MRRLCCVFFLVLLGVTAPAVTAADRGRFALFCSSLTLCLASQFHFSMPAPSRPHPVAIVARRRWPSITVALFVACLFHCRFVWPWVLALLLLRLVRVCCVVCTADGAGGRGRQRLTSRFGGQGGAAAALFFSAVAGRGRGLGCGLGFRAGHRLRRRRGSGGLRRLLSVSSLAPTRDSASRWPWSAALQGRSGAGEGHRQQAAAGLHPRGRARPGGRLSPKSLSSVLLPRLRPRPRQLPTLREEPGRRRDVKGRRGGAAPSALSRSGTGVTDAANTAAS